MIEVTPENFPNVSDYRNPFIAEAMKVLGYVESFQSGCLSGTEGIGRKR